MQISVHRLSPGSGLDLTFRAAGSGAADGESLTVVIGGGKGCVLRTDAAAGGIWIPLRGRIQIGGDGLELPLPAGKLRVTEPEGGIRAIGRGDALWVALLGSRPAWRRHLHAMFEMPVPDPPLLPACHVCGRELKRSVVALMRASDLRLAARAVERILHGVLALQEDLAEAIERCPGRTYAQRRQVFVRLQRVRTYLAANCHLDIDNDELAAMANYSPWHFIRAFRAAYQETPHAYLVRQRLDRAHLLLRASPLAIAEIALASGFENRCAFARLFRQRFGVTAGAVRRRETGQAPLASAAP